MEACNGGGCTDAPFATAADQLQAIGSAKASSTGAGDWFGCAVALSGSAYPY